MVVDPLDIRARQNEKRVENLKWANKVRIAQAEMKRRLREGRIDPVLMLEGYDKTWSRFAREVKIGVLLNAIPRLGNSTVREILAECQMYPEDRLKEVEEWQRDRCIHLVKILLTRE